jgi:glycosyltransferase involved in cell wall biosynthesis
VGGSILPTGSLPLRRHLATLTQKIADRFPPLAWFVRAISKLVWWTVTLQLASRLRLRKHRLSDLRLIASSDLFDREWYLKENPNIRGAGIPPALHYLLFGAAAGRDPSPLFDGDWYLSQHPDARQAGANPLVHYLRHGALEGRPPNPPFNGGQPLAVGPGLRTAERNATRNPSALNIILINYGSFNNNSAGHIVGFADALAERGHNVIMCANGDPQKVADYGVSRVRCVSRAALMTGPETLPELLGEGIGGAPTLIHCWTTRENVRLAATAAIGNLGCPYFIHLEDNEEVVTRSLLGITAAHAGRMTGDEWDRRVPSALSHPLHARAFISGAAGVTIIVDSLRALVPDNLPVHLLEPGLDATLLSSELDQADRIALCHELGVPSGARIIVYTGNIHAANAEEMLCLYEAIHLLNRRGTKVHLIRTGADYHPHRNYEFGRLSRQHVSHLGVVDRRRLTEILKLADVFVQPGAANEFNDYRLPSKLPDFMAAGRPLILPATNLGLRLRDGVDALLLRRGDATEIADRVAEILRDDDLADRLGRHARRFATENFNWHRSASGLEGFYRNSLAAGTTATVPAPGATNAGR